MATRACLRERVERRLHKEVTIACLAAAEHIFPRTDNTVKESLDRVSQSPIMGRALDLDAGLRPHSDRLQLPKKREHLRLPARGNAR